MKSVLYNECMIEYVEGYDVVVVGGGTSGCLAALSAARQGLKVLVIERNTILTGTMANSLVQPMMPSNCPLSSTTKLFIDKLQAYGQVALRQGSSKTIWYNADDAHYVISSLFDEYNIDVLYNTTLIDTVAKDNVVNQIIIMSFNQLLAVKINNIIDASGDAILARLLKIKVNQGDENNANQEVSLRFEIGNIDIEKFRLFLKENNYTFNDCSSDEFFEYAYLDNNSFCKEMDIIISEALNNNDLCKDDVIYIQAFSIPSKPHVLTFNAPQIKGSNQACNALELSKYVRIGHQMQLRLFNFFKKYVPGFSDAYINKIANNLGIRESYRIESICDMTHHDYIKRSKFDDGIACGDWYLDVHSSEHQDKSYCKYKEDEYYEISYRSLITHEYQNYIACGRHIGSDFLMQSSIRIQPTVMAIGDACGYACAYSNMMGIALNQIDGKEIRKLMKRGTCFE